MGGMVDLSWRWVAIDAKERNLTHLVKSASDRRLRIESENATSPFSSEEELSECEPRPSRAGGLFSIAPRMAHVFFNSPARPAVF